MRLDDNAAAGHRFRAWQGPTHILPEQLGRQQGHQHIAAEGVKPDLPNRAIDEKPVQYPGQTNIPDHFGMKPVQPKPDDNCAEQQHEQPVEHIAIKAEKHSDHDQTGHVQRPVHPVQMDQVTRQQQPVLALVDESAIELESARQTG